MHAYLDLVVAELYFAAGVISEVVQQAFLPPKPTLSTYTEVQSRSSRSVELKTKMCDYYCRTDSRPPELVNRDCITS